MSSFYNFKETRLVKLNPEARMPMYAEKYRSHPVAEDLGWRGVTLPSSPDLTDEELGYICNQIHDYFKS